MRVRNPPSVDSVSVGSRFCCGSAAIVQLLDRLLRWVRVVVNSFRVDVFVKVVQTNSSSNSGLCVRRRLAIVITMITTIAMMPNTFSLNRLLLVIC